ncbi:MAG: GH39 family glycosyl hydrolase [Isosphaeraceae bacterium]
MRTFSLFTAICLIWGLSALAQPPKGTVKVYFDQRIGLMEIDRMALGQGGLSDEPMWDSRVAEIRSLRPRLIRLFVQEYFQLLRPLDPYNRYHFEILDRSVEAILNTGATPLMCLCFKPKPFFGPVDQDHVEPTSYEEWNELIFQLVKHYRVRGAGIRYWEIANEPDIGESGGCPYRFQPDSYVRYYSQTAAAILKADPSARVGGPALANVRSPILPALLNACEGRALPLNFVSWHIYSSEPARIRATVEYVKELLRKHPKLKPETVLDEWNMDLQDPPLDPRFQPCYVLETIWQMKSAGLDWSCYYHIRDFHVSDELFAPFLSPRGLAFMSRWWNRMPQFDGLFDYQNHVRPSFFAFKLLARLTGERLRLDSSLASVHGFATADKQYAINSLLLWNFSDSPAAVELNLEGIPRDMLVRHLTLDALAPSDDENARLRPEPHARIGKGTHRMFVELGPRAIKFWSFE